MSVNTTKKEHPFLFYFEDKAIGQDASSLIPKKERNREYYFSWKNTKLLADGDNLVFINKNANRIGFYEVKQTEIKSTYDSQKNQSSFNEDYNTYRERGNWSEFALIEQIQEWDLDWNWHWSVNQLNKISTGVIYDGEKERIDDKIAQLKDLMGLFAYGQVHGEIVKYFYLSVDLKLGLKLANKIPYELIGEDEFHFEYARETFDDFLRFKANKDFYKKLRIEIKELKGADQKYVELVKSKDINSKEYELLLLMGKLITYFDMKGGNKEEWNEYGPPRSLAKASVRQYDWGSNLLQFKIDNHSDKNISARVIKNAIKYIQNPRGEITMLSPDHRENVSDQLLKKPYQPSTFVEDVKAFFAPYEFEFQNEDNRTHTYGFLLYEHRALWDTNKKEQTMEIKGLMASDDTGWIEVLKENLEGETYNHGIVWWHRKPDGMPETLIALKKCIETKGYFNFYLSKKQLVNYKIRVVDISEAYEYLDKNWNINKDVYWYQENFEDYVDDNKKATIVYLVDQVESVQISISNFEFVDGKKPKRGNCVPFFNVHDIQNEVTEIAKVTQLNSGQILNQIHLFIGSNGFHFQYNDIVNFYLSLKTKPFVILAGISGTGKTQLIKQFAKAIGYGDEEHCQIIPVRPDWTDNSDLIGYLDLNQVFQQKELLQIMLRAKANPNGPYFVVLDEMNLARVEHYLSDFLSIIETRRMENGRIQTDIILKDSDLGENHVTKNELSGLQIPDNLYIIGTVNMDETTHPFSRKVLDRANSIEMNEVNLEWQNISEKVEAFNNKVFNDFLKSKYINSSDIAEKERNYLQPFIQELIAINQILQTADLHFAYRIRDEIAFYLLYNRRWDTNDLSHLLEENVAFDFQIMQKVLPRIQGSSIRVKRVIINLLKYLNDGLEINEEMLFDEIEKAATKKDFRYPQSSKKLLFMLKRYEDDGFTSFWL